MTQLPEEVTVGRCPVCEQPHTFPLKIGRSRVWALSGDETDDVRTFTCLFVCPSRSEPFKVPLRMRAPAGVRILSVEPGEAVPAS